MHKIRLIIADDHPVFLEGLCNVLQLKDPSLAILDRARDGTEAVDLYRRHQPDVTVLDIKMPGTDGIQAAREIKKLNPDAKILILTTFDEREHINSALAAGANGYLLKDSPVDYIVKAIHMVYEGMFASSPSVTRTLVSGASPAGESEPDELLENLAPREKQILFLIADGKLNPEIAEELNIKEKTVRNYITKIYDVLGVKNRSQAVIWVRDFLNR